MRDESRVAMTGVEVRYDTATGRWTAWCDDPAEEGRLSVSAETRERAERLLDERWRARVDGLDREEEEDR